MTIQNVGTSWFDPSIEKAALERRRDYARLLQKESLQAPEAKMVSGHYIAPHFMEHIGKLAQGLLARSQLNDADTAEKTLSEKARADLIDTLQRGEEARRGMPGTPDTTTGEIAPEQMPEQPPMPIGNTMQPTAPATREMGPTAAVQQPGLDAKSLGQALLPQATQGAAQGAVPEPGAATQLPQLSGMTQQAGTPAIPGDPYKQMQIYATAGDPGLRQLGMAGLGALPEREEKRDERRLARQQAQAALEAAERRHAEGLISNEELKRIQIESNERIAKLKTGTQIYLGDQRAGAKESAADKKQQAVQDKMESGAESVDTIVSGMRDNYAQLKEGGGVVDENQPWYENAAARIGSSGFGQTVGGTVGTKNQRIRDSLDSQRPMLLNAVKQAANISAQELNSNAELKFYVQAATDPTKGHESNMQALNMIEKLYGPQGIRIQQMRNGAKGSSFKAPASLSVDPTAPVSAGAQAVRKPQVSNAPSAPAAGGEIKFLGYE